MAIKLIRPDDVPLAPSPRGGGVPQVPNVSNRGLENVGNALLKFGEREMAAESRMQTREEAVQRVRAVSSYETAIAGEFGRLQTEDDLSKPETLKKFGGYLAEQQQALLDSSGGSQDSRSRLSARLEQIRAHASDKAAAESVRMQRDMVKSALDSRLNATMSQAADPTIPLSDVYARIDTEIDDLAPALSPDEERAQRIGGRSQAAQARISSYMARGAFDEADDLLSDPDISRDIGASAQRALKDRIISGRMMRQKTTRDLAAKVSAVETVIGRPLAQNEKLILAGIEPKAPASSLSTKIGEAETALGRQLTPTEIEKMSGIAHAENPFGSGVTGGALDVFVKDTPSFGSGLLSPDKERRYLAAVTQYSQPTTYTDPDTGEIETRRPELPLFVQDALRQRGMQVPSTAGTPLRPATGGGAPTAPQPAGTTEPEEALPAGDKTIWDIANDTTGAIPAIARQVGRTPFIGEILPAPQMTQAKSYTEILQRNLITALQNSPRYAEGERRAIENEIDISPRFADTVTAYRNRLIGVDDALKVREQNAAKTGQDMTLPVVERRHALAVRNAIEQFRDSLGIPPLVRTPDEARKLPPGTVFRTPDHRIMRVPDARQ